MNRKERPHGKRKKAPQRKLESEPIYRQDPGRQAAVQELHRRHEERSGVPGGAVQPEPHRREPLRAAIVRCR